MSETFGYLKHSRTIVLYSEECTGGIKNHVRYCTVKTASIWDYFYVQTWRPDQFRTMLDGMIPENSPVVRGKFSQAFAELI